MSRKCGFYVVLAIAALALVVSWAIRVVEAQSEPLIARKGPRPISLTVNAPAGVRTSPTPGTRSYPQGTNVYINAPLSYHDQGVYYIFHHWIGGVKRPTSARTNVIMDAEKTVTPIYIKYATIIADSKILCKQPGRYIGWPSIAQASNGDLLAVFSGDREEHGSPDGKVQMVRSRDRGKTWSDAVTIYDTPIDDRDSGIILTKSGALLVSWFTGPSDTEWLGHWTIRSTDNGYTWSDPVRTEVTTPHGPVQLSDGRLLFIGQRPHECHPGGFDVGIQQSTDDGLSWQTLGTFPVPPDDLRYDECHLVECASGKLVITFRDYFTPNLMRRSESTDGGRTWSKTDLTVVRGYPPHVIRLWNDWDWLLVVYGKRWRPFGEYACISRDEGKTWDLQHEIKLSSAPNHDLGYPASVQLDDGSIWTVYYQRENEYQKPYLMGTHWRLHSLNKEDLRERAVQTLRRSLQEGKKWVKVHAAEGLIWNGYLQDARETFLDEFKKNPGPQYRIGVWRVLAQAVGKGTTEHKNYVNKIRDALLDRAGPDRGHAGETLGKLGYAEPLDEIVRIAADPKEDKGNVRWGARWILANSGRPEDERYLTELLDSEDATTSAITGYALRWQKQLAPETLAKLEKALDNDSVQPIYFLSALYVHSGQDVLTGIKSQLLSYAVNGDSEQKGEVCAALSCRGNPKDLWLLEELMADQDLDVRVNAANAVLKILTRAGVPAQE